MRRREKPKLRPAAEFIDRDIADEAWAALADAGVPGTLEHTPRSFGQGGYTRLYVAASDLSSAQELLRDFVIRDRSDEAT